MNILFVCTGNTCRSPMAAALLKKKFPQAEVQSAGVFAGENQRANRHTITSLQQKGIELEHQSQPVGPRLLNWADIVLTMTTQHKQSLILQYPDYSDTFYTLKEYVSETDKEGWRELKQAYATYEDKRSTFVQENLHKYDNTILNQKLAQHLQPDIDKIQALERDLISYDISDPFGGDLSVYEKTLDEMETYIDMLVDKLSQTET